MCTYLSVHSGDDGTPHVHTESEAAVEVLVEEEGLHNGGHKQQRRIHVALPVWLTVILTEVYEQPSESRGEHDTSSQLQNTNINA